MRPSFDFPDRTRLDGRPHDVTPGASTRGRSVTPPLAIRWRSSIRMHSPSHARCTHSPQMPSYILHVPTPLGVDSRSSPLVACCSDDRLAPCSASAVPQVSAPGGQGRKTGRGAAPCGENHASEQHARERAANGGPADAAAHRGIATTCSGGRSVVRAVSPRGACAGTAARRGWMESP